MCRSLRNIFIFIQEEPKEVKVSGVGIHCTYLCVLNVVSFIIFKYPAFNPFKLNGISHSYQFDQYISI